MPNGKRRCLTSSIAGRSIIRAFVIVTATTAPRKMGLCLADLASRLDWGLAYQLRELDDEGKQALQLRAELRGFKLPVDVGRFLLNRLSRDMHTLLQTLNELDTLAGCQAQTDHSLCQRGAETLTLPLIRGSPARSVVVDRCVPCPLTTIGRSSSAGLLLRI